MKVGFVVGGFPPDVRGGAENYVIETATQLQNRGHDVFVITTQPYDGMGSLQPRKETVEGIDTYRFFPLNIAHKSSYERFPFPVQTVWKLLDSPNPHAARTIGDILDDEQPDVVHTNNLEGISTVAARVVQRADIRHVHTLHDYSLISPNSTLRIDGLDHLDGNHSLGNHPLVCAGFGRFQRLLFGRADVVTGPSQYIVDAHRRYGFFRGARAERLQLGVDTVAEEPPEPPEDPAVLYVGRITPIKGVDTILDAALRAPEVTFHFCGTGPYQDVLAERSTQTDNVVYHGFVTDQELQALREQSTVGVVPSVWPENSPLTIYESLSVGLPIIGSDVGGIPELVIPGETGALFDAGDPAALLEALQQIRDDDQETLREHCLAWAREHTLDQHVDRLLEDVYVS